MGIVAGATALLLSVDFGADPGVPAAPQASALQTSRTAVRLDPNGVERLELRLARGSVVVRGIPPGRGIEVRVIRCSRATDPEVVVLKTAREQRALRIAAVHPSHPAHLLDQCPLDDEELVEARCRDRAVHGLRRDAPIDGLDWRRAAGE
jgi:hypothetical protein